MNPNSFLGNPQVVLNRPGASVYDIGLVCEKNIKQSLIIAGTGVLSEVTFNSANIGMVARPNWVIEINTGTGFGQRRVITAVSGNTIYVANWQTHPDNNADFTLYSDRNAIFIYRQLDNKFILGLSSDVDTTEIHDVVPATLVVGGIESSPESIWYVGKHGSDINTGRTISTARLTFGSIPPGATIVCLDSGVYAETVTLYRCYAPNASITTVTATSSVTLGQVTTLTMAGTGHVAAKTISNLIISATATISVGTLGGMSSVTAPVRGVVNLLTGTITTNSVVELMVAKSTAATVAVVTPPGVATILSSDVDAYTSTGNCRIVDAKYITGHVTSTNNPHNVTIAQISPLTTKGDLLGFSTTTSRFPPGADGQILQVDSAAPLGLSWRTVTTSAAQNTFALASTIEVNDVEWSTVWEFAWLVTQYNFTSAIICFYTTGAFELQITGAVTYLTQIVASAGYKTYAFSPPVVDDTLVVAVRRTSATHIIKGVVIKLF